MKMDLRHAPNHGNTGRRPVYNAGRDDRSIRLRVYAVQQKRLEPSSLFQSQSRNKS